MNILIGLLLGGLGLYVLKGTPAFRIVIGIGLMYIGIEAILPLGCTVGSNTIVVF